LEEHPEWRTRSEISGDKFPVELKIIDSNNDNYISLKELQKATNKLFDGDKSINEELLNKAMNYAFNEQ
jgi:Ca2+-binding EF-hand superfamily protein